MKATAHRRRVKRDPPEAQAGFTTGDIEVRRPDGDGLLDEIVSKRPVHVHIERMDRDHIWMTVGDVTINLWTVAGDTIFGRAEPHA